MNNRDLLRAMGEIDEKYIEEAAKEIRTAEDAPEELPVKAASEASSAKAAETPDPAAKVEHISAARKKKNGKYRAATQWILYVAAAAVALLVAGRFLMPVTQKETAKTETSAVESAAAEREKTAAEETAAMEVDEEAVPVQGMTADEAADEATGAEEAAAMEEDEETAPVQGMTADEADAAGETADMAEDEEAAPVQGMTAGETDAAGEAADMAEDEEAAPVQGMTAGEADAAGKTAGMTDDAAWTDAEEEADFAEEAAFYAEEAEDDNGWYAPETGAAAYAPETAAAYASGEEADAAGEEADAAEEGAGAGPVEEDHGTYTFLRTDKPFDTADYPGGSYYLVGLKLVWVFKDGDGIRTAVWGDETYTARIDAKEGALTPEAFREAYRACS